MSMAEIAKKLGTTHATVLYWLKKYGVPRRSSSESAYAKQNPNGDPFHITGTVTPKQRELLIAGLLLYWAEGSKTQSATRIANLDARMLKLFGRFLCEICHVDKKRLSVYVRLHRRFSPGMAKKYWAQFLGLPETRVSVYPHTDRRSKADQQWSRYGLATLEFHNTKFKRWLNDAIEQYVSGALNGKAQLEEAVSVDAIDKWG